MRNSLENRLLLYRRILKKEQRLFEAAGYLYDNGEKQKDIVSMAAVYVMAPVMYQFVEWVLKNAVVAGQKRLYFLARDGYSMYHIAKIICEQRKLPIDCRYLYSSRYAWRTAQYHLIGEESLHYICLGGIDVTFEKVMRRSGVTKEEGMQMARTVGFEKGYQDILSYDDLTLLKDKLAADRNFMELMTGRSERNYPLVIGYLEQEGLMDQEPFALVDSGWTGSMQKTLNQLLMSRGGAIPRMEGYYFGLYEYPSDTLPETYHTYYFSPKKGLLRKVYFCNSLFECIFSSPEGMTTGYMLEEGRYKPVLEKKKNPNFENIEKTTKILCGYAHYQAGRSDDSSEGSLDVTKRLLYYFMGHPLKEEARIFGDYVFCDDVIDEKNQTVAADLSCQEIKDNWLLNKSKSFLKKNRAVRESAWLEGSTVLVGETKWTGLFHAALYKYVLYLRKQMKRGYVS